MATIKHPNKNVCEIISVISVFLIAIGLGIFAGFYKNDANWAKALKWLTILFAIVLVFVLIIMWIQYAMRANRFNKLLANKSEKIAEIQQEKPDEVTPIVSSNLSWIYSVPNKSDSPIQFASDKNFKKAIECCDTARASINYNTDLEKYSPMELDAMNLYIRQVIEWGLRFVNYNDPLLKKQHSYYTIFDGKKYVFDTDIIIDKKDISCIWSFAKKEDENIFVYVTVTPTGKSIYHKSYKHILGMNLQGKWKHNDPSGSIIALQWAKAYPNDHSIQLIKDVTLDIYNSTSKNVHNSDDGKEIIDRVYKKYLKDSDKSDKAKALLLAKCMFNQTCYVLWFIANKYSNYKKPFTKVDASVYKAK